MSHPHPDPPPDVMLAPHHGGRTANPGALYKWAGPRAVVVSQRAPRKGAADALTPLERQDIPLWRTWRDGAVRLRWTAGGIAASGYLARDDSSMERPDDARSSPAGSNRPLPLAMIGMGPWAIGFRVAIGLGGFAIGAILWVVVTIVEFGAWTLVVPPRGDGRRRPDGEAGLRAPEAARPPEPIEAEATDGVRLAGRWYPALNEIHGSRTVLLLHGFAEDPSAWEAGRASILNRHGWNVAALDSRGYGRSGGLHASFGGREAADIAAWLDAIAARPAALDPTVAFRAAVWGRSMGAAIAMRGGRPEPSDRGPGTRIAHGRPRPVGRRPVTKAGPEMHRRAGPPDHRPRRPDRRRAAPPSASTRRGPARYLPRPDRPRDG